MGSCKHNVLTTEEEAESSPKSIKSVIIYSCYFKLLLVSFSVEYKGEMFLFSSVAINEGWSVRDSKRNMLNVLDLCLSCSKWKMFTLNLLDLCSLEVETTVPDHV